MANLGGERWASILTGRRSVLTGRRLGGAGLAGVMVAAAVAVAFGTGFTVTKTLTNDGSAWMRKGDTIVHVNGPSGRFDAVVGDRPMALAASARDQLEVVQSPDGQVYTADQATHHVYKVDLGTMTPHPGPAGTAVLANGAKAYVVDQRNGMVTPVDPQTLAPGPGIRVPGGIASQAIGPDGVAYLGQTDGSVTEVRDGRARTVKVAASKGPLNVTVVGGQPTAVDTTGGRVYPLSSSGGSPSSSIVLPGAGGPVEVSSDLPGGVLFLVRGHNLVAVDLSAARSAAASLPAGDTFGAPVVNGNRVYVPDDTSGRVLVYDTRDLSSVTSIPVPPGAPGVHDIETFVHGGRVWIDNPSSQDATVVNPDGTTQNIDKGTGNQVVNPNAPPAKPAVPTVQPPPSPVAPPTAVPAPSGTPSGAGAPSPVPIPAPVAPRRGPVAAPPVSRPPVNRAAPPTPMAPAKPQGSVPSVKGMDPSTACATLKSNSPPLACSAQDKGQAPAGAQAGAVFAQSPAAGATATSGATVTIEYYSSLPVPAAKSGETPDAYCQRVDPLGLNCSPSNQGQGAPGKPANVVYATSPAEGSPVAAGAQVGAEYYSGAPPATVTVPECPVGTAVNGCPVTAGITWAYAPQTTPSAVAARTVWHQQTPPGTVVPYGTTVTTLYDPNAATWFGEYHDVIHTNVFYLSTSQTAPAGYQPEQANGWAYPVANGACAKAGTTLIFSFVYDANQKNSGGYQHHYFTTNPNFSDAGWSGKTAIACVFTSNVAGSQAVYDHYINKPTVPGDHSWELTPGNGSSYSTVWYQPTHQN